MIKFSFQIGNMLIPVKVFINCYSQEFGVFDLFDEVVVNHEGFVLIFVLTGIRFLVRLEFYVTALSHIYVEFVCNHIPIQGF